MIISLSAMDKELLLVNMYGPNKDNTHILFFFFLFFFGVSLKLSNASKIKCCSSSPWARYRNPPSPPPPPPPPGGFLETMIFG